MENEGVFDLGQNTRIDFHAAAMGSTSWRQLEEFRTTAAHKELAIAAALNFCAEWNVTPPEWLVEASAALMIDLLKSQKTKRRGRAAGYIASYRQHLWDLDRWDAVHEIRRIREKLKGELRLIRGMTADAQTQWQKRVQHIERFIQWFRYGTLRCAGMYLTGRDSRAGDHAIRASYRRIERKNAREERHPCFDDIFLSKIGLPTSHERKPGTKWLPLFNLEP